MKPRNPDEYQTKYWKLTLKILCSASYLAFQKSSISGRASSQPSADSSWSASWIHTEWANYLVIITQPYITRQDRYVLPSVGRKETRCVTREKPVRQSQPFEEDLSSSALTVEPRLQPRHVSMLCPVPRQFSNLKSMQHTCKRTQFSCSLRNSQQTSKECCNQNCQFHHCCWILKFCRGCKYALKVELMSKVGQGGVQRLCFYLKNDV